jgi:hypothetical protein
VLLGTVADAINLKTALVVTALGPAVGVAVTLLLPSDRRARQTPVAEAA